MQPRPRVCAHRRQSLPSFGSKSAVLLLTTLLAFAATGRAQVSQDGMAPERSASLRLFVATDIHYLAPELTDGGQAFRAFMASADGRQMDYVDAIVEAFVRDVTLLKPNVLVISGDLTTNGEKLSHQQLAGKLKRIEQAAGTRVFVIPGNHDILNPWARGFRGNEQYRTDAITPDEFKTIYGEFGYGEAISSDTSTLSYLAAPSNDTWLLMLDTNTYRINQLLGRPATEGKLTAKTLEWIRQCCEQAKQRHARIITVMHHNVADHSDVLRSGYTVANSPAIRTQFAALGLDVVLSGHVHIQDIRRVDTGAAPLYDIATSALSIYPQQYGMLDIAPSGDISYRTARVDVETWARETGATNSTLKAFASDSKQLFIAASSDKTFASLTKAGIPLADSRLMADTMGSLNAHYFAGTLNLAKDDITRSAGYRLWETSPETTRLKQYVLSMVPATTVDNNRLAIPAPVGNTE